MKVVLVTPPIMDRSGGRSWGTLQPIAHDRHRECPPYGIYMLASVLRNAGHEVVIADLVALGSENIEPFSRHLGNCALVGIGATSLSWPTACAAIRQIRVLRPDVPIVLGGIHPTMFDRYLLHAFPIQYVIRGEAEIALPALCNCLEASGDLAQVPNLSWRRQPDGAVIRNRIGPKIPGEGLALFPLPDYETLPSGIYKGLSIESSRGCAFDCSFCSTSYRRSWRPIPAEQFVDRLESVMPYTDRTLLGYIHIVDDEFSTNPRRATEIAKMIRRRGLHPKLVYDSRATDLLRDGYVENISEFTLNFLVGAECGYDDGLKRIGKGTTCDVLERAAQMLQRYGISDRADFSFILGLPWESRNEVEKTIRFAAHLYATYGVRILLQWYCQIPGSRLWQADYSNGLITPAMYDDFGFFRDLHLFFSGIHLHPRDIWEIGDIVDQLKILANLRDENQNMIEFALPMPIYQNFPRELWQSEDSGLPSLREVSWPNRTNPREIRPGGPVLREPIDIGVPTRHIGQ